MSSLFEKSAVEPEADLVVTFVNTRDLEEGTDAIADPAHFAAWIADSDWGEAPALDAESLQQVHALRESLRALLRANNGIEVDEEELAGLRDAVQRSRYQPTLSADGHVILEPAANDLAAFEARLLLAVERIQSLGAWPRLKACGDDGCQWAFFDTTRNHSKTWCSMEDCGNREKTRRYRERKTSAQPAPAKR